MAEKIGLYFVPANEGDFLTGLPARDLTEAEVAEYEARDPALIGRATAVHPTTGKSLYTKAKPTGKRAASAASSTDAPDDPAEDGD